MARSRCVAPLSLVCPFTYHTPQRSYNELIQPAGGTRLSELLLPTTSRNAAGLKHVLFSSFTPDPAWLASMLPAPVSGGPEVSLVVNVNKSGKVSGAGRELPGWAHALMQLERGQRADCPSWWQVISPGAGEPLAQATHLHVLTDRQRARAAGAASTSSSSWSSTPTACASAS